MFAIVGLGNPGSEYERTRHNAGFWAVDAIREELASSDSWKSKGGCEFIKTGLDGESLLLVKPMEFMNLSGEALAPLLRFFKVTDDKLILIYDEIDLPTGFVRVSRGGSAGGHNGVSDVIQHVGGGRFYKIRIGIGRPNSGESKGRAGNVTSWVLGKPGSQEQELLEKAVLTAQEAAFHLVRHGLEATQQKFNQKVKTKE